MYMEPRERVEHPLPFVCTIEHHEWYALHVLHSMRMHADANLSVSEQVSYLRPPSQRCFSIDVCRALAAKCIPRTVSLAFVSVRTNGS